VPASRARAEVGVDVGDHAGEAPHVRDGLADYGPGAPAAERGGQHEDDGKHRAEHGVDERADEKPTVEEIREGIGWVAKDTACSRQTSPITTCLLRRQLNPVNAAVASRVSPSRGATRRPVERHQAAGRCSGPSRAPRPGRRCPSPGRAAAALPCDRVPLGAGAHRRPGRRGRRRSRGAGPPVYPTGPLRRALALHDLAVPGHPQRGNRVRSPGRERLRLARNVAQQSEANSAAREDPVQRVQESQVRQIVTELFRALRRASGRCFT